jgi:alkyl sulfatase BDS1-like metallo-beta-lactamase superfamily hydrolase
MALVSLVSACGVMAQPATEPLKPRPNVQEIQSVRAQVLRDAPKLTQVIRKGGAFSSEFSVAIANRMYSRTDEAAIADARAKLRVESHGPRTWLLRLPFVNIAVFETDEGLVLIDSGYAPAGPALRETLERLSSKPVHTIVHTHWHADHAWGAWTLMDKGPNGGRPRIVTTEAFIDQMQQNLRSHGFVQRSHQQVVVPREWSDVLVPSLTIKGKTTLTVGGEDFVLNPARGETEDQMWVWVPSRRTVISADYFQGFMPNAGNGWRRQRFVDDWAQALRDMAALKPRLVMSMHGPALVTEDDIQDKFEAHAAVLKHIADQAVQGVNAGLRTDQIVDRVKLPPSLAQRPDMKPDYVTEKDIARMVVRQFIGWYEGLPSTWSPAPLAEQAKALAEAAGGARALVQKARALVEKEPAVAASLADWAWLAAPKDKEVLQGAYEVYVRRVRDDSTTQEALTYLDHLVELRIALSAAP